MLLTASALGCATHASYLVAGEAADMVAIVEPPRDIDPYLQEASRLRLDSRHPYLTHDHTAFLAGPQELRERVRGRCLKPSGWRRPISNTIPTATMQGLRVTPW